MAGLRQLDRDGDYYPLPRNRKIILSLVLSLTFVNIVVIVATIVRPVPQYSSTGALLELQAQNALTFSRRWLYDKHKDLAPDRGHSLALPAGQGVMKHAVASFVARHISQESDCGCTTDYAGALWPTATTSHHKTTHATKMRETSTHVKPKATHTGAAVSNSSVAGDLVNANQFVAIWLGTLGACLERA